MTVVHLRQIEAIWTTFSGSLRGFILKRVSNSEATDDILQEVFLRIHSRIATLKDPARLQGWVYRIARNAISDHFRAQKRAEPVSDLVPADDPPSDEDLDLSPTIRRMIRTLPDDYREALVMTEYEGLTQRELASRLGISLPGAKSRVQRARGKLKDMLLECCHLEFDRFGKLIEMQPRGDCCNQCGAAAGNSPGLDGTCRGGISSAGTNQSHGRNPARRPTRK